MNLEETEYERARARLWLHHWRVGVTTNPPSQEACGLVLDELAFLTKDRDSWRTLAEGVDRRCDALIAERAQLREDIRVMAEGLQAVASVDDQDHLTVTPRQVADAVARALPANSRGCGSECSEGHSYVEPCELARQVCPKCGTAGCAEDARISWCDTDQEV